MFLSELKELTDISDSIEAEPEIRFFSDDEAHELYDTFIHLMECYVEDHPKAITEPNFLETFEEDIFDLLYIHFDDDPFFNDEATDEMNEIFDKAMDDFFKHYYPMRSHPSNDVHTPVNKEAVKERIAYLQTIPQPVQRTKEWYEFRHGLITASNAYKAFESQVIKNQLIYEKCQPLQQSEESEPESEDELSETEEAENDTKQIIIQEVKMVNINTTLHWGQKYEPLSVKLYEQRNKCQVGEFGCIPHQKYSFLGASPDGIILDETSDKYGRMLEIKNIVNREINGIPKKEYWVQMQLQMEVCDLDYCDFLETRFNEYNGYDDFKEDHTPENKGVILYFHKPDGSPFYVYKILDPSDYDKLDELEEWEQQKISEIETQNGILWIKNYYWKLDQLSCVLVERNRKWFADNIWELQELWDTILRERVTGYAHRAPVKKIKRDQQQTTDKPPTGCLLNINKVTGKVGLNIIKIDI